MEYRVEYLTGRQIHVRDGGPAPTELGEMNKTKNKSGRMTLEIKNLPSTAIKAQGYRASLAVGNEVCMQIVQLIGLSPRSKQRQQDADEQKETGK